MKWLGALLFGGAVWLVPQLSRDAEVVKLNQNLEAFMQPLEELEGELGRLRQLADEIEGHAMLNRVTFILTILTFCLSFMPNPCRKKVAVEQLTAAQQALQLQNQGLDARLQALQLQNQGLQARLQRAEQELQALAARLPSVPDVGQAPPDVGPAPPAERDEVLEMQESPPRQLAAEAGGGDGPLAEDSAAETPDALLAEPATAEVELPVVIPVTRVTVAKHPETVAGDPLPDDAVVVIDNNLESCKFGIAGELVPRVVLQFEESPKDEHGLISRQNVPYMLDILTYGMRKMGVPPQTHRVAIHDPEVQNFQCRQCQGNCPTCIARGLCDMWASQLRILEMRRNSVMRYDSVRSLVKDFRFGVMVEVGRVSSKVMKLDHEHVRIPNVPHFVEHAGENLAATLAAEIQEVLGDRVELDITVVLAGDKADDELRQLQKVLQDELPEPFNVLEPTQTRHSVWLAAALLAQTVPQTTVPTWFTHATFAREVQRTVSRALSE